MPVQGLIKLTNKIVLVGYVIVFRTNFLILVVTDIILDIKFRLCIFWSLSNVYCLVNRGYMLIIVAMRSFERPCLRGGVG